MSHDISNMLGQAVSNAVYDHLTGLLYNVLLCILFPCRNCHFS